MPKHPRALANENITPERYAELRAICRQYRQYVRTLERARAGVEDAPARRSGSWKRPDPTGNTATSLADRYAWISGRVRLIEGCVHAVADSAIAPALLESITEDRGYDTLRHRPPCGREYFYKARLLFFVLLDSRLRVG